MTRNFEIGSSQERPVFIDPAAAPVVDLVCTVLNAQPRLNLRTAAADTGAAGAADTPPVDLRGAERSRKQLIETTRRTNRSRGPHVEIT